MIISVKTNVNIGRRLFKNIYTNVLDFLCKQRIIMLKGGVKVEINRKNRVNRKKVCG